MSSQNMLNEDFIYDSLCQLVQLGDEVIFEHMTILIRGKIIQIDTNATGDKTATIQAGDDYMTFVRRSIGFVLFNDQLNAFKSKNPERFI